MPAEAAMRMVWLPSVNHIVMGAESESPTKYVDKNLGPFYNSCIVEVTEELGAVKLLGNDIYNVKLRMRSSFQTLYYFLIIYEKQKSIISKNLQITIKIIEVF